MTKGIFKAKKKDGSIYYRSSFLRKGKKISLGSYENAILASAAYHEAIRLYEDTDINIDNFEEYIKTLSYDKCVCILNYRDNGLYMKTPIYLRGTYLSYFLPPVGELKFDREDMFYYSSHTIMNRGGHLFINDYGSQYTLKERYGIMPYAVKDRDYSFANGDELDFRYENIIIKNQYRGVRIKERLSGRIYTAKIHIRGEFILGNFSDIHDAAICYNKGVDTAKLFGIKKNFKKNYIEEISSDEYKTRYESITLSKKYLQYLGKH